ncbi:MAG: hypothetical protein QOK90_10505 [Nitrososphaeraceae archaeon]|nr:hypothetical protein [Nitrososphaeraceae archaeon]
MWKCEYQKDETWKCEKVKASANIPPGLTDALNDATGPKANLNDRGVLEDPTTLPKLEQDVGPRGGLGNLQENNTFSRANISALDQVSAYRISYRFYSRRKVYF